jgi:hypothetical protein
MSKDTTRTPNKPAAKAVPRKAPAKKAADHRTGTVALRATAAATGPAVGARKRTTGKAIVEPTAVLGAATPPTAAPAAKSSPDTITFMGREMAVRRPSPEQVALWPRIARRIEERQGDLDETPRDGESPQDVVARVNAAAEGMVGRLLDLITSVLVEAPDREWIEDQMATGKLRLAPSEDTPAAYSILSMAVQHFAAKDGTGGARTTGPAPKARRR